MNLLGSKKGQFHNYLAVLVFLFIFGFMSILGAYILSKLIDAFITAGWYTGILQTTGNNFFNALIFLDYIIVIIMFVLIIGIGITSYKINAPPIFFIVTLAIGTLSGAVSFFFNYIFSQIVSDGTFDAILLYFPRTLLINTNLHWVALICIIVGSITLYAKKERGTFVEG